MNPSLGQIIRSFFEDYLRVQKGLRPASVRSYRDGLRLFLMFVATEIGSRITRLGLSDLTFDAAKRFLRHLEEERHNHIRTRNQRLALLRTFFEYVSIRVPEMLGTSQQVAAIPIKRVSRPETHFLEEHEVSDLLSGLPRAGRHALRDRALVLFLYNTGARAQEVSDLMRSNLDLGDQPRVNLHGKGDKWRRCPLWKETVDQLRLLLADAVPEATDVPVFCSRPGRPLTRFGIYKIVRRHAAKLDRRGPQPKQISPHIFRHTSAVHLLESGVELNVIRDWLGHVSIETTNRYAEVTTRAKEKALRTCEPSLALKQARPVWKDDKALLAWLEAL